MNKQKIYTGIGITLSLLIAIGGWILTSALIDKKSDALLSLTGITTIDAPGIMSTPGITENADDRSPNSPMSERPVLTEQQIYEILQNWESSGNEKPHEPKEGQLNMEQAIAAGKTGLTYFSEQGIIPVELAGYKYDKTNAYLCQNLIDEQIRFLDSVYSYWTVTFTSEQMSANLIINAVTGQIWKASITIFNENIDSGEVNPKHALDAFASYTGISLNEATDAVYGENKISAFKSSSGNTFNAIISMETLTAKNKNMITDISISISTKTPIKSDSTITDTEKFRIE